MTEEIRYTRLSIYTKGNTITITQKAKNLSDALNQELKYAAGRPDNDIAQVNISKEDK